jgi:CheY-like chemotaxis protein
MACILVVDDNRFAAETIAEKLLELGHHSVLSIDGIRSTNRVPD